MPVYLDGTETTSASSTAAPAQHDLAGAEHIEDTLADFNSKVTDFSVGAPVTQQATTPVTITASDSGKSYTDEGSSAQIEFTLPTAVSGLEFTFLIQSANGIKVIAASGDTIRIAGTESAVAGNIAAATIGNVVKLKAINDTEWLSVSTQGTWVVS